MPSGSLTLKDHPGDMVIVICDKCERIWRLPKPLLARKFGMNANMPDLKWKITGCDKTEYHDYCGAYYDRSVKK